MEKNVTPIVIATKGSKSINVLLESIEQYVPEEVMVYIYGTWNRVETWTMHGSRFEWIGENDKDNFGDSFNHALTQCWLDGHETAIMANDDVVLDPNTYWLLTHDRVILKQQGHKVGFVSARSNMATMPQNIRFKQETDQWAGMKWASEETIAQVEWTAPLFASVDKEGFPGFPPTNFYSDNVACADMATEGYKHFLSRAYVHHVGSITIGRGFGSDSKNMMEAEPWLKLNRPLLHKRYFLGSI